MTTEPLYLFLIKYEDAWSVATREGHLVVAREGELMEGSPLIRADHPKSTVPHTDLMAGYRGNVQIPGKLSTSVR